MLTVRCRRNMTKFDPIEWIRRNFELEEADSASFVYAAQESLSNRAVPGIYREFDPSIDIHVRYRGRTLDYAAVFADGRILDFGPGEGCPSLLIAPYVRQVIGVDASEKRVQVCAANAKRTGAANARFVFVEPKAPLPFSDDSFDGVVASYSVEQSPDLQATLREICRILKPGGCFRFEPETLNRYRDGHEQEVWLPEAIGGNRALTIFDRDLEQERAAHYGLLLDMTSPECAKDVVDALMKQHPPILPLAALSDEVMQALRPFVLRAGTWVTEHPSYTSWPKRLLAAGFTQAQVTYSGAWIADRLLGVLAGERRPKTLRELDELLTPVARMASSMEAPPEPQSDEYLFVTAMK